MNRLCTTSTLIATTGLVTLLTMAGGPQPTHLPEQPIPPSLGQTHAPSGGSIAGGAECVYDNFRKLDDFGSPASQKDVTYPFYAEAADDFMLPGEGANGCVLTEIHTSVTFFNTPGGLPVHPFDCWAGVNVTIYEDISAGVPDPLIPQCLGFDKGPAGFHHDETQQGVQCFEGAIVCDLKIPFASVDVLEQDTVFIPNGLWDMSKAGPMKVRPYGAGAAAQRWRKMAITLNQLFLIRSPGT